VSDEQIKQDINFLEKPLWVIDEGLFNLQKIKKGRKMYDAQVWEASDYTYEALTTIPTRFDGIVLMSLLKEAQENNWNPMIKTSLYQIIKSCGFPLNQKHYERVKDSLDTWRHVSLHFNAFYHKPSMDQTFIKQYSELHFGVVDSWGVNKDKKGIYIRFSPEWLQIIQESRYYKYLDFGKYKTLTSPIAARLYEILVKSFEGRANWKIGAVKLAEKITMRERYASDIERKIKAAVNQVNQKTDLRIDLLIEKPQRGECFFTFTKRSDEDTGNSQDKLPVAIIHKNEEQAFIDREPTVSSAPAAPDPITQKLKTLGFMDAAKMRDHMTDQDWGLAFQDLEFEIKRRERLRRQFMQEHQGGWLRTQINNSLPGEPYQPSTWFQKHLLKQQAEKTATEIRLKEETDRELEKQVAKRKVAAIEAEIQALSPDQKADLQREAERRVLERTGGKRPIGFNGSVMFEKRIVYEEKHTANGV